MEGFINDNHVSFQHHIMPLRVALANHLLGVNLGIDCPISVEKLMLALDLNTKLSNGTE
jgi:hypothetical protein